MTIAILFLSMISVVINIFLLLELLKEGRAFRRWTTTTDLDIKNILEHCTKQLWQSRMDTLVDANNVKCERIDMMIMKLRDDLDGISKQIGK